jgi:hypothetical protein
VNSGCYEITGLFGPDGEDGHVDLSLNPATGFCSILADVRVGGPGALLTQIGHGLAAIERQVAADQEKEMLT